MSDPYFTYVAFMHHSQDPHDVRLADATAVTVYVAHRGELTNNVAAHFNIGNIPRGKRVASCQTLVAAGWQPSGDWDYDNVHGTRFPNHPRAPYLQVSPVPVGPT